MITLSPITRRRLANFRANRRGFWSLWLFLVIFVLSLFAELLANDKPILVSHEGGLAFPVFQFHAETDFGGEFETEADYRDPYVQELILGRDVDGDGVVEGCEGGACHQGLMVWPLIRFSHDTTNFNIATAPSPPSAENWLGTDDQGRDVLARLIYGVRISVLFGLALTILASAIGIAAGAVQGYFGGLTDLIFQRVIEIWQGMPVLYLLIIMAAVIEPGFFSLLFLMLLFSWMALVDVVRAEFLRVRNFDYVRAAKALGVDDLVIMWRHMLPNAMVATVTFLPFILTSSITTLTSLDFLGLGLPPGSPSLGELLNQGKNNLQAPWLGFTAFLSLAVLLSLLTFVGEAVRDAFDPRKALGGPVAQQGPASQAVTPSSQSAA